MTDPRGSTRDPLAGAVFGEGNRSGNTVLLFDKAAQSRRAGAHRLIVHCAKDSGELLGGHLSFVRRLWPHPQSDDAAHPEWLVPKLAYAQRSPFLTQPLYAGYLELPKRNVSFRPAKHEGLISFETFQTIQNRLNGIARLPARKDISEDFPLRGFVLCGCCGTPLTANWSKGKAVHYPYYLCRQKDCTAKGRSIRREVVEQEFEALPKALRPTEELFELASALFKDLWEQRAKVMKDQGKSMKAELSQIERKIAPLMDRLVEADSESVIRAYEKRIGDLETDRMVMREKIEKCGKPLATYEDTFEHSMEFLANPWKILENDQIEYRQTVLKLAFADQLAHDRDNGFRTP